MSRPSDYKKPYRKGTDPCKPPDLDDRWEDLSDRLILLNDDIDTWRQDYLKARGDDKEQRWVQVVADLMFSYLNGDEREQEILRQCVADLSTYKATRKSSGPVT